MAGEALSQDNQLNFQPGGRAPEYGFIGYLQSDSSLGRPGQSLTLLAKTLLGFFVVFFLSSNGSHWEGMCKRH
jgi:hypothetical protein